MATSSFDTVVTINKKSAKSLDEILNINQHKTIDLYTKTDIKKINATNLEVLINKKRKVSKLLGL